MGVTGAHYGILKNLAVSPGITGAELARRLHVTPQNIASLLTKLIERGWVERREHEIHTYVRELHLTLEGQRVLQDADAQVSDLEMSLREHLGVEQTTMLRGLLERTAELPV